MRYAAKTDVSVAKSKAEIEHLLQRYGASGFMSGWTGTRAQIAFVMAGRQIKFNLKLPDQNERRFTHTEGRELERSPAAAGREWEQACRQSWRALALVIKAKLEAVESGISDIETEFLSNIVLADGRTVGEHVLPRIAEGYERGEVPRLTFGGK